MQEKYTTKEETLYCLCERIPRSKLLKRSVLVFDGFTGFTPLQVRVIGELLRVSMQIIVTLPYEEGAKDDLGNLFYLSERTIATLSKEAKDITTIEPPVYLSVHNRCRVMIRHIQDLIKERGYRYRDMAVICPNPAQYELDRRTALQGAFRGTPAASRVIFSYQHEKNGCPEAADSIQRFFTEGVLSK